MTKNVDDQSFASEVLQSKNLVLVDFWAEWCGPCKQLLPILEQVSFEAHDLVKVCKVNIDESPDAPTKYGVRSIPTMMLFKDGNVISTKIGALPKSSILDWIKEFA